LAQAFPTWSARLRDLRCAEQAGHAKMISHAGNTRGLLGPQTAKHVLTPCWLGEYGSFKCSSRTAISAWTGLSSKTLRHASMRPQPFWRLGAGFLSATSAAIAAKACHQSHGKTRCATSQSSSEFVVQHSVADVREKLPGGAICTDHFFKVPLNYIGQDIDAEEITVFVREVVLAKNSEKAKELPTLLYLQGGPGFPSARPTDASSGWLGHALKDHRVLLLDQRGTGRSTPITAQTLRRMQPGAQAAYLTHFRADSIVRDCELIRKTLGISRLGLLGQSYGGFCSLTYLSLFPGSLRVVYLTGGLAPVLQPGPDEVYRSTYRRVLTRNKRFYSQYPGDVKKVREIVAHLQDEGGVRLPGGGLLTARRFLSLGLGLGSGSGMESMHWLLESAFVDVADKRELDYRFLVQVEAMQAFDTNPIYWMLHESIYCGMDSGASRWSAQRVLGEAPFKDAFDYQAALANSSEPPLMFTGEMVYPWFADDFATLGGLREAAELLAAKNDWGGLYDLNVLRDTSVPVAAAVYYEDMFVELAFSEETASLLGEKCKIWVSNEFQHSGLKDGGAHVLSMLMKMASGEANVPS